MKLDQEPTIVTIGGGTGTPVVNEALLLAGAKSILSIVTVMDSGGLTGRRRTDSRGQEVAFSDALRTLLSLVDPAEKNLPRYQALEQTLRSRTETDQLGYAFLSNLFDKENGFSAAQEVLEKLTGIKFRGQVIPVTTQSTNIAFQTLSQEVFRGEHELDNHRMSKDTVQKIWLDPNVVAFPQAVEAIRSAGLVIFALGSLHGSVLVNLLPEGIKEAYGQNHGTRIHITNLASTRNETDNYYPENFIEKFREYTGLETPLDYLIVPKMTRMRFEKEFPEVAQKYDNEHSHFLGWEKKQLQEHQLCVKLLFHEATFVEPLHHRLRHNPKMLAETLKPLIPH